MSASLPIWTVEGRAAALKRKARKQVEGAAPAERDRGAGGAAFNIWCAPLRPAAARRRSIRAARRLTRRRSVALTMHARRYGKFNTMRENREAERAGCVACVRCVRARAGL